MAAGSCGSTSARRRASARPTPCSARDTAAPSAAPTSSSGSSRPTAASTPRRCSTAWRSVPRHSSRYRGTTFTEMDVDAVLARRPEGRPGRRARPHQRARIAQREALAGHRGAARGRHRRHLHRQHPAPRVAQRRRREDHRRAPAGDRARRRGPRRRPGRAGRHDRRRRCGGGWRTATSTPRRRSTPPSANYFRVGNLTALRELALLWTADRVDEALQRYREQHDIAGTWEARERVVVALTGGPEGETLIRRAARIAARSSGGDLLAVHVARSDGLTGASPGALAAQRRLVESLGGTYHQVLGDDVPDALLAFARAENATQLVLGDSRRPAWARLFSPGIGDPHRPRLRRHRRPHRHPRPDRPRRRAAPRARQPQHRGAGLQRLRPCGAAAPAAHPGPGPVPQRAEPGQRRAAVPAPDRGRRTRRRPRPGPARRRGRIAAAQLLLHPAAAHVHHQRDQQRARARGLRAGRRAGQLGGGPGGAADPAGRPCGRRVAHPGHPRRHGAGRGRGAPGDAGAGPGDLRAHFGHAAGADRRPAGHRSPAQDPRSPDLQTPTPRCRRATGSSSRYAADCCMPRTNA